MGWSSVVVIASVLKCPSRALHKCDTSLFNKLVGIYPELAVHERALDTFIDLLRKDAVSTLYNR